MAKERYLNGDSLNPAIVRANNQQKWIIFWALKRLLRVLRYITFLFNYQLFKEIIIGENKPKTKE